MEEKKSCCCGSNEPEKEKKEPASTSACCGGGSPNSGLWKVRGILFGIVLLAALGVILYSKFGPK